MKKVFQSPIIRTTKPHYLTSASRTDSIDNCNICNEVLAVVNSARPMESSLNKLFPFLYRDVVVSVLSSLSNHSINKDSKLCFRFFNWASEKARFRSGVSQKLIIDILVSGGGNKNVNSDSFDLYWSVLDELRNENLPIFADTFVVLILGYWKLNQAEKAVETFGKMKDYQCKPNLAAYNVILNVLVKKDVMLMALAVYNSMLKSNHQMSSETFNVLIDGLCKSGMIDDALKLFDEMTMKNILPSKITNTVILSGLCKAKRLDDARRLFDLMKRNGSEINIVTYNTLLDGFCKYGRIDEAIALLKSFKNEEDFNLGIKGFSSLIDGFVRAKRISEAELLFNKVFEFDLVPDVVLYTIMMHGLCEAKRLEDAVNMLRDMITRKILPDTQCYNVLIKGFCDAGLLDQAQSLKLEISNNGQFPNTCTYTVLICGMCKNGLLKEAEKIFLEMENLGCSPSVVTFNALIDGLCKAGKLEEAHLMLYKMEIGKNPSLFLRLSQGADRVLDSASLMKNVQNLIESGLFLKAYKLLIKLSDSGVLPDIKTYNTLINGMCKSGQVNGAFKLFEELQLKGRSPDAITYGTLIEGLQREDRNDEAFKLFERMQIIGCKPTPSVYKTLMTWSCRRTKLSLSFTIWLKYLRSLGGWEGKDLKLVEEHIVNEEFSKAVRCLLETESKLAYFDSSPYTIWLIGLCQANHVEESLRTFSILQEFNVAVSAPGCVKLISALCSVGKLDEAVEIFLYTTDKGYKLKRPICNTLLEVLLSSKDTAALAFDVLQKMKSSGYDLNCYLNKSIKLLLNSNEGK